MTSQRKCIESQSSSSFLTADIYYQRLQKGYSFGIKELDSLFNLYPGSLTLFHGNLSRNVLRKFLTDLIVSLLLANPTTELIFIDGANIFPYFEISVKTKTCGVDPFFILDRIQLARAFNFHQMTEIITNRLPKLIKERLPNTCFLIIPQISSLHLSKEAAQYLAYDKRPITASLSELTASLGILKQLILKFDLIGILTAETAPQSKQKALGGTYLAHSATSVIRIDFVPKNTKRQYDFQFVLQQDPEKAVSQTKLVFEIFSEKGQTASLLKFLNKLDDKKE